MLVMYERKGTAGGQWWEARLFCRLGFLPNPSPCNTGLTLRQRYALDTSGLASVVNSDGADHFGRHSFFQNLSGDSHTLQAQGGIQTPRR